MADTRANRTDRRRRDTPSSSTKSSALETAGRQRVQLDFSADAYERLTQLRDLTDARSNAELVRKALQVFEWFVKMKLDGYQVQVSKDDKTTAMALLY